MPYLLDVMTDRRKAPPFVRGTLAALSYLFQAGIKARHWAYERHYLTSTQLSVPVISIGNIVIGGTGKTPFTQLLVNALHDRCRVAILSRGYQSQMERSGKVHLIARQGTPFFSPDVCGDEPFLLGQTTQADVWVGRDRVECGRRAIEEGAQCLVLDDGMQHRKLARDLELVMIDGRDPFAQERFLPRGLLRDFPSRLRNADLVIANHVITQEQVQRLNAQLKKYTDAPLLTLHVDMVETEALRGKKVGLFCGLGRPERFIDTIQHVGVDLVATLLLNDHKRPTDLQLRDFAKRCREQGAELLLCTYKDWVKLSQNFSCDLPIVPVKMQLKLFSGQEHWDRLLQRIEEYLLKDLFRN